MRPNFLSFILAVLTMVATVENSQAATPVGLLTAREQALMLQRVGMTGGRVASSQGPFLADVERAIRRANPGVNAQSLRQPVSETVLRNLQVRLELRGIFISQSELRAATDYAHALLVEGNGKVSLAEKVNKLPDQLRKPFHGKVAEIAEARERGMVLNKSATATTWDLTEPKFQPCNLQMKIYAQHDNALTSMINDLDRRLDFNKRGILTKDTLERNVKAGRLVREGNVYRPTGRSDIRLEPSKVFARPTDSHLYAKTGRESLIKRGLATKPASTGFQTAGKWLGRAGIVSLVATEGYVIQGFASGQLSEREFVTAQGAIVGGGLGVWGGATAGAALGAFGGPFAPITVPAGGVIGSLAGGFGGAKLGEMAVSGFYGRMDEKQKREIHAFIYQHYGVSE
ncbi:MAG: hypothetical protein SFY92_10595 [Verrucomicrobiae bacterium]|nr:hypothetical protein [Verrucomicrobiae bacterium]